MTETGSHGAIFVIHGLAHLRAALAAGAATGRAVAVMSAPHASAYAGAAWFAAVTRQGQAEFPEVRLTAIFDCGDRAGDALSAIGTGVRHLVFTGQTEAAQRLKAIAAEKGVEMLDQRPEAFDLLNQPDPNFAARAWCEKLPE